MVSRTVALFPLLVGMSSTGCGGSAETNEGVGEARAAIEAANTKFGEAFARGDANALAAMCTSDAIVCPSDSEMVRRIWNNLPANN